MRGVLDAVPAPIQTESVAVMRDVFPRFVTFALSR